MNVYETKSIKERIAGNSYVGRGIVTGKSADGTQAVAAYFIMGRSANSKNRIFSNEGGCILTKPFDPSKVEDPSLIIYTAVRPYENYLIVTNGDQTDTIYEGLQNGKTFAQALQSRAFEPDAPNFTPRISSVLTFSEDDFSYEMSILKSIDAQGSGCARYHFSYPSTAGLGHFIHTYMQDGNPLPTFFGEPERVFVPNDIDAFTTDIWDNLDAENKISLYVIYIDMQNGQVQTRLLNKNR